jgi:hypothetical protein
MMAKGKKWTKARREQFEESLRKKYAKKFEQIDPSEFPSEGTVPDLGKSKPFTLSGTFTPTDETFDHPLTRVTAAEFENSDTNTIRRERDLVRFQLTQVHDVIVTLDLQLVQRRSEQKDLNARDAGLQRVLDRRR